MSGEKLIKEAEEFLEEAKRELSEANGRKGILRDACEKGWNAVVIATNCLILDKKSIKAKSHYERRKALESIEKEDPEVRNKGIYDRFAARTHYLQEQGFYGGYMEEEEIEKELEKVSSYIEDIKKLI